MTREIKFRAWDGNRMVLPQALPAFLEEHFDFQYGSFRKIEYKNGILMQYTGINDKNGVDVYEGDFVQYEKKGSPKNPIHGPVVFKCGRFCLENLITGGFRNNFFVSPSFRQGYKVIGNVYENPDIMEKINIANAQDDK
jgi:uncharacterized phage protein (TIGR01671 family)